MTIDPSIDLRFASEQNNRLSREREESLTFKYNASSTEYLHHSVLQRRPIQISLKPIDSLFARCGEDDWGPSIAKVLRAEEVTLFERSKGRVRMVEELVEVVFAYWVGDATRIGGRKAFERKVGGKHFVAEGEGCSSFRMRQHIRLQFPRR